MDETKTREVMAKIKTEMLKYLDESLIRKVQAIDEFKILISTENRIDLAIPLVRLDEEKKAIDTLKSYIGDMFNEDAQDNIITEVLGEANEH